LRSNQRRFSDQERRLPGIYLEKSADPIATPDAKFAHVCETARKEISNIFSVAFKLGARAFAEDFLNLRDANICSLACCWWLIL